MKSEAKLTFFEASSLIVGHGVGSGILAVPYLASRNRLTDMFIIVIVAYCINLLLHFMVAELSYRHQGVQFIKCFQAELFVGRFAKPLTWLAFGLLGYSVIISISGFIVGASDVLVSWFNIPNWLAVFIFYGVCSLVVLFGMKIVGIFEKVSVGMMTIVLLILFFTILGSPKPFSNQFHGYQNWIVLYSIFSFSLSAVMSVPQVVKGLDGDIKQIKKAIAVGTLINLSFILLITFTTLLGVSGNITTRGALVDLAEFHGGWIKVIGYLFSLLALATSFWAYTLNLRDVILEQLPVRRFTSWLISSTPSLVLAIVGTSSFVQLVRFASVVQIATGIGIIISFHRSLKKESSLLCGFFGTIPFEVLVVISSILATVGALVKVR